MFVYQQIRHNIEIELKEFIFKTEKKSVIGKYDHENINHRAWLWTTENKKKYILVGRVCASQIN